MTTAQLEGSLNGAMLHWNEKISSQRHTHRPVVCKYVAYRPVSRSVVGHAGL